MMLGEYWEIVAVSLRCLARSSLARVLAVALMISPVPLVAMTSQTLAQVTFSASFAYFRSALAPYGNWYSHPRWGDVWRPTRVELDFRPYYRGHWEYTVQFGWVWASDYTWGDIPFHYGRWVYDRYDGWLWIPGYVWGPAWVIWRSGGGYTGWFPMPPDDGFLFGFDLYRTRWDNWDRAYGYYDWYGPSFGPNLFISFWIFVEDRHFADRDYVRYILPRDRFTGIINNTTNATNYVTVNNYIVNRSVDVNRIERAAGRRIPVVEPREVVRRGTPVTTVDVGRRVEENERSRHARDPNASPRARISSLPEARTREILPPVARPDEHSDRDRESVRSRPERVIPSEPGERRDESRPGRDGLEEPRVFVPSQPRDRTTEGVRPSEPSARLQERAPRIEQARPELRQGPLPETLLKGETQRRSDRRPQSERAEAERGKRSTAR